MRKFTGLLPEVKKRRLHKQRGCASIHHFAAKLAGMSERTVDKILSIAEKLEDKPHLKKLLINGEVGWSKLQVVAHIATTDTDSQWAEKVKKMPYAALEAFVQEHRKNLQTKKSTTNFLTKNELTLSLTRTGHVEKEIANSQINLESNQQAIEISIDKSSQQQTPWERISFMIDPEIAFKLKLRKQQIEKHKRETLSWNEAFIEITKNWDMTSPMIKRIPKEKEIDWGTY